ncbi:tRNA-uridine aminocarboxypropyltransferase [Shewanella sp. 3_MG-2023]|uniref:tRNA-uridine aminocarboxypropyltransferase n=1 Tax=Shewanella sp. 3_MG-2023 TaxID=3062635 RepID=UPI0026E47276|nr:tRNA-uridine aminocarboxypropyltransferase [Shewanella sp. 3_MG-2023]MDO6774438.1 tRNA-uridine aminocarboxypropyltransferase [Shewanella sp. 3_MG-2023]
MAFNCIDMFKEWVIRIICKSCGYPQSACICDSVTKMEAKTEVIVLQHPSEVEHAKNTVKLLSLTLPQTQVVVGESADDFALLRQQLAAANKPVYLVYPCENSQNAADSSVPADCCILLIDGTWRKAFKMLQLNPWLLELPALHIEFEGVSQYLIRKAKRSDSLSTLEATAYTLQAIDSELDISPLFSAFDAMVQHKLNAMPAEVRARYIESKNNQEG